MCKRIRDLCSRCPTKLKMAPNSGGIKTPKFWQSVLAEFLATFWLVLLGCASWIDTQDRVGLLQQIAIAQNVTVVAVDNNDIPVASPATAVRVALTFGKSALIFYFRNNVVFPEIIYQWSFLRGLAFHLYN